MIAKSMELAGSSVIRTMFEEGKKMARVRSRSVYDFSVGNLDYIWV